MIYDDDDYDAYSEQDLQAVKTYVIGAKTWTVGLYEHWHNDETQVNFGIVLSASPTKVLVVQTHAAESNKDGEDQTWPSLIEVKHALSIAHKHTLTPRELLEQQIGSLEQQQKWRADYVRTTTSTTTRRTREVETAVEDAKLRAVEAYRDQVRAEAELVQVESQLTATRTALAELG